MCCHRRHLHVVPRVDLRRAPGKLFANQVPSVLGTLFTNRRKLNWKQAGLHDELVARREVVRGIRVGQGGGSAHDRARDGIAVTGERGPPTVVLAPGRIGAAQADPRCPGSSRSGRCRRCRRWRIRVGRMPRGDRERLQVAGDAESVHPRQLEDTSGHVLLEHAGPPRPAAARRISIDASPSASAKAGSRSEFHTALLSVRSSAVRTWRKRVGVSGRAVTCAAPDLSSTT